MKKVIQVLVFMLAMISIFLVAACSSQTNTPVNQPEPIDYDQALYQLKDTYTGDNSKVHEIVNTLSKKEPSLKSLEFTLELQTDREPYRINVFYLVDSRTNYRSNEDIETAWNKNAAVIFSLIPNAGEITFHLEDEYDIFAASYYQREKLSEHPGMGYFTEDIVKKAADSMESFSAYLFKVSGIKNVSEFYSAEERLFHERARQVYDIIGADYDFYINEGLDFSVLITKEFIENAPIKVLADQKERLTGAVGKEIDFIIYGTRNYKTDDWFGPPHLFLFDGEKLVTYVNLENQDGQREVQQSLKAIEKMGILKTKLSVRYWLGEEGEKTIEYFVRSHSNGQKDLLDSQDKVILSGYEKYDLILNYLSAKM